MVTGTENKRLHTASSLLSDLVGVRLFMVASVCLTATAMFAGCAPHPQVREFPPAAVRSNKDAPTDEDVKNAIIRAGDATGWTVDEQGEHVLVATRKKKSRLARVSIEYYQSVYSIKYKESSHFNYTRRPQSNLNGTIHDFDFATIHPDYNEWVEALNQEIQRQLANIQ